MMTIRYSPFSIPKVNKKILFLILMILSFSSCRQQKLTTALNNFTMTEIQLPEMRQMVMGEDSVSIDLDTVPILMVVYRDPDSCVPCQLDHMYDYRDIIDFEGETGGGFSPVFIFSPKKKSIDTVHLTLCRTRFRHPIFLDENGLFRASNKNIPKEPELHVFLLDKNRKVFLAGDPSHNPALWRLYKKIIVTMLENGGAMP